MTESRDLEREPSPEAKTIAQRLPIVSRFEQKVWVAAMLDAHAAAAVARERGACCRDVCQFCREGRPVEKSGDHVLEVIQGHIAHETRCPAAAIRARSVSP